MKSASRIPENYFVDEAGDPVFYNAKGDLIVGNEGCSKVLIIGYIRTPNPKPLRDAIEKVRQEVKHDKYF